MRSFHRTYVNIKDSACPGQSFVPCSIDDGTKDSEFQESETCFAGLCGIVRTPGPPAEDSTPKCNSQWPAGRINFVTLEPKC